MSSDLEICEILQSLENNVICTICGCAPKPGLNTRWYNCFKRHLICTHCVDIDGYSECSKCNEPIAPKQDKIMKSLMMTNQDLNNNNFTKIRPKSGRKNVMHCNGFIDSVAFYQCKHAIRGCQVKTPDKKVMAKHETGNCPFSFVSSLLDRLTSLVSFSNVNWKKVYANESQSFEYLYDKGICKYYTPKTKHSNKSEINFHSNKSEINRKFSFTDSMMQEDDGKHFSLLVSIIEKFGKVFLERIEMDENGQFFHWIQYLGRSDETHQYYYIIQYRGKYGERYVLDELFHGEVLPMTIKPANMKIEQCLKTTRTNLETFMLDHLGSFKYTIQLKKS